jgi:hypothetical protein
MRLFAFFFLLITSKLLSQSQQLITADNLAKGTQYAANDFAGLYANEKEAYNKQKKDDEIAGLKEFYQSHESYPDSIITGWHEVVVTDNSRILRGAKVYVSSNRIRKFVIDNCIELTFTADEPVSGKASVTLTKVSGEPLKTFDIYFMDDLEKPTTFDPPLEPGYVCFWTREGKSVGREIVLSGKRIEAVSKKSDGPPECFDASTSTVVMKPGMYKVEILKTGNNIDTVIKVQAGTCTFYELK